jgi:hypothetical protein
MLNTIIKTPDLRAIALLAKGAPKSQVDLTESSPITNSVTTASSHYISKKNPKGMFQTTLSNQFQSTPGLWGHPDAVRSANVTLAHFALSNLLSFRLGECILL